MRFSKIKLTIAAVALAASFSMFGSVANAETIDNGTVTTYVGDSISKSTSNLKINGKAYKKQKSKVKTIVVEKHAQNSMYRTKDYYTTSGAYDTYSAYAAENEDEAYKFYPKETTYTMIFKKAGSYKISVEDYVSDFYDYEYDDYDYDNGVYVYDIYKLDIQTGYLEDITKAYRITGYDYYDNDDYDISDTVTINGKTYQRAVETYYAGFDGSIYAYGDEFVPAKINKCSDGRFHVRYSANKPRKVNYVTTYKVLACDAIIKSVKLGKAKQTYSNKHKVGGYSYKATRGKFLTGNSGKLEVTMGDKNFKLGGNIIVETSDEKSRTVYNQVGNKKTVTYGNYLYNQFANYTYDDGKKWGYQYVDPFKATTLHIPFTVVSDECGTTVSGSGDSYVITNYYQEIIKGKKYKHQTVYNINIVKETFDDGSFEYQFKYKYTVTDPYYDSATKTVKTDTIVSDDLTKTANDITDFMSYYHTYVFYKN